MIIIIAGVSKYIYFSIIYFKFDLYKLCHMFFCKSTAIFFGSIVNGSFDSLKKADVVSELAKVIETGPIWDENCVPVYDPQAMSNLIKTQQVKRILIVGHSIGFYKTFLAKSLMMAGLTGDEIALLNFREYGIFKNYNAPFAASIILCKLMNVEFESVYPGKEMAVNDATLIIGGGIAGIQAALEIANSKHKVYLVEKSGTIGGHMALFDKTFPTLDCAACILTPKMVEVGQNPYIELLSYSEVSFINGFAGNYKVRVIRKARRVDAKLCIGCGTCAEKCPRTAYSEFDSGTTLRKAIYIPFPQAVPNKYLIDAANCTYVENGKCGVCARVCPVPDCIKLDEEDHEVEFTVGNIILATGFKPFDARRIEQYGYGKYPNVLTSLEFERLLNASGPTGGSIKNRTTDKKGNIIFSSEGGDPGSIAFIHCIGSRDHHFNKYCSRVCCMYSLKMAHLAAEKLPSAEIFEYFIDMRAYGKGYEEFYKRVKKENIHIQRGKAARVLPAGNKLFIRTEDIEGQKIMLQEVDMVVLAVGLEPNDSYEWLSDMLSIPVDEYGWFVESNYLNNPVDTHKAGVHIAGTCQGPKDIPDTVAQASAAASRVIQSIIRGTIYLPVRDVYLEEIIPKLNAFIQKKEGIV
jgi:heterodisulfide reductase subunit A